MNDLISTICFLLQGYGSWITQSVNHRTPWNHQHYYPSDSQFSVTAFDHNTDPGNFHSGPSHSKSISEGTYSFIHLSPNTEYEVKIRAKNSYGWSDDEPAFVFKTSNRGESFFFYSYPVLTKATFY